MYQNAPRAAKGAMIGGAAGAVVGTVAMGGFTGAAVGGVLGATTGGLIGAYLQDNTEIEKALEARNVQVVRLGDYVKIIVPSSQLFNFGTTHLTEGGKSTLDEVISVIAPFQKISIAVSAYSHDSGEIALTDRQAQLVASYLWKSGADTRLITATGYGDAKPLMHDYLASGQNDRVEITLRDLSNS